MEGTVTISIKEYENLTRCQKLCSGMVGFKCYNSDPKKGLSPIYFEMINVDDAIKKLVEANENMRQWNNSKLESYFEEAIELLAIKDKTISSLELMLHIKNGKKKPWWKFW